MEWMNRGERQGQSVAPSQQTAASATKKAKIKGFERLQLAHIGLLFSAVILVVAVLLFMGVSGNNKAEGEYVDKSKYQAVFLNGGQVYFGKIKDLNSKFLSMGNIYYLRVNQQVQPNQSNNNAANDISLVKLGCELHGPQDNMVINREQIIFWENLKDDGQVAKAVAEYEKQNPGEQKCDTAGTGQSNTTNTTNTSETTNTSNTSNTNNNTGNTSNTNNTTR